ncbi:MAG: hypothetical protein HOA61_13830, partial [Bacteroidetes bacterium]|nr:hypothetical protein [Bacteroidota bacterium]
MLKIKVFKPLVILVLFAFSMQIHAQEKQKNWSLNGYVKDMQSILFTEVDSDWMNDNLIHNRLNFKWYMTKSLTLDVEMRNRFMFGDFVKYIPGYAKIVDNEQGFIDMSGLIFSEKSFLLHSTIDRAWIDYTKGKFQVRIGRQRINWSQTFAWNPNDLFNTYSFFDFDYEEKPGSDAVKIVYYTGMTSQLEVAVKADYKDRLTAAAMYRFNKWGYDFQFIGGVFESDDIVIGGGWSGQLFKGGLRGEFSIFQPIKGTSSSNPALLVSAGYDYTFKNSLMFQTEVLYNLNGKEDGDFDLNEFYFMDLSAKNLSL